MATSPPPAPRPIHFQRAMVFIDGTNLFHRLASPRLKLREPLSERFWAACGLEGRQLVRAYLYTSPPHLEAAKLVHGESAFDNTRVVLGDAIRTRDGNWKEKGVDALLVADLVYHAAVKNFDYAILVSCDTDFCRALKKS